MPVLTVPEPAEQHAVSMSDGAQILLRRYGNPAGPRLALSHGNGLAIDAYLPFWQLLAGRYDLVLFDMRNHGRNPLHRLEGHTWERMTLDMGEIRDAIAARFGPRPVTGAFHSLSAVAAVRYVLDGGTGWSRLVLFDPPIYPPEGHPLIVRQEQHLQDMVRRSRRRTEWYHSPHEFAGLIRSRPQFSRWREGAHELFARSTLRREPETGLWHLACPRQFEAHIFETNRDGTVWPRVVEAFAVPMAIIGADPDLATHEGPALVCRALAEAAGLHYQNVPGTTHLLQLEEPEACVAALERAIASLDA